MSSGPGGTLAEQLNKSWRFFYGRGFIDGFGHISARTEDPEVILISPHSLGAKSEPEDFVKVDLAGRVVAGKGALPGELAIHLSVYKNRPDVGSVAHFHSLYATSFSMSEVRLGPAYFLATIFGGIPIHNDSRFINTEARGAALAATLGTARGALLKAHGIVVTGPDVVEMTGGAFILEDNAKRAWTAAAMGTPKFLDEAAAREIEEEILAYKGPFRRIWALCESEYEGR
jgi:ribulose-5-phosphate 4-epimerase/fuculose-1-phosphate aldolase